jgi:hypothetical protein
MRRSSSDQISIFSAISMADHSADAWRRKAVIEHTVQRGCPLLVRRQNVECEFVQPNRSRGFGLNRSNASGSSASLKLEDSKSSRNRPSVRFRMYSVIVATKFRHLNVATAQCRKLCGAVPSENAHRFAEAGWPEGVLLDQGIDLSEIGGVRGRCWSKGDLSMKRTLLIGMLLTLAVVAGAVNEERITIVGTRTIKLLPTPTQGYKALAAKLHPDKGGSHEAMARLNRVRDNLKRNCVSDPRQEDSYRYEEAVDRSRG